MAPDEAPPEGALRVYVWRCEDGRKLTMRNLFRERAIEIDLDEGTQRLDQTVSASGVRYANEGEAVVFWTKGDTARVERHGALPVPCRELRAESLREDARARGVIYRALGNEPGWTLEIGPDGTLDWTTNYGEERHVFEDAVETAGGDLTSRRFTASSAAQSIAVTVRVEPCTDDAGVAFDYAATIEFAGGTLRGCAVRLN